MTKKERLFTMLMVAKTSASRVRNEMYRRDYTSAEKDIEILCNFLTDELLNNFTDEEACRLADKLGFN